MYVFEHEFTQAERVKIIKLYIILANNGVV